MIAKLLQRRLEPVAQRQRQWRFWKDLTLGWTVLAAVALGFVLVKRFHGWDSPLTPWVLGLVALAAGVRIWWRTGNWAPDYRQLARQIERHQPELHALLLTAVEQRPDPATRQYHYLQERVIQQAIDESVKQRWIDVVSRRQLFWMRCGHLAALAALAGLLINLPSVTPAPPSAAAATGKTGIEVTPGDALVERGSGLVVMARVTGPLPAEVHLVVGADTNTAWRLPLSKTLNDPIFGGSLKEVQSNLVYHLEFDDQRTRDFKVTVFDHPRLERADARLTFPEFTGLGVKQIPDTRRVTAVEGSTLDLALQLNKPVKSAAFVAKDRTVVPLEVDTNKPLASLKSFAIQTNKIFDLQLVDEAGRTNKVPAQFVIDAVPNRRPEIKVASPRGDHRVSPLEEITFQGEAVDDFGLRGLGLTYRVGGGASNSVVLGQSASAGEKKPFTHLLKLEDLGTQPDQLIAWFVWADDVGPDGQVRRSSSDMYFLEVRPFEEIFREAQAPDSQGEQQQQQRQNEAGKLAESQKQIVNATWKLQRQETGKDPSEPYKRDAGVVKQAQESLLEKMQAAKERVEDPRMQGLIEAVEKEMEKAVKHLTAATDSPAPLPDALTAEQAAYQALLKLSTREVQVAKSRNRQSQGQQSAQMQSQLDQLDLKQSDDRYEKQSQAATPQTAEQQEQLTILNRLKELAQRQNDLNEKIKELQTALQEAKTDAEREEIRRRLKRLREEEQQLLADVDELRQRMEQSENQALTADARKQLEKTRADVQRAAEALRQEEASQALAAGTRAQRDLQQLRDDFRKKNASQFTEDMRKLRAEARDLAQKEEDIGKQIEGLSENNRRKTLTDSDEAKGVADRMQQQKGSLTNVLDAMRRVSEQAETSEPLLSKHLYDTLRKASQANTDNSLSLSQELLKKNFVREAGQFEQRARSEIHDLKRGVERAAESVLGDETEALRLAKRELDDLSRQIENEIAQANASGSPGGPQTNQNQRAQARAGGGRQQNQTPNAQRGQAAQAGQPQGDDQDPAAASPQDQNSGQQAQQRGAGQQSQQANARSASQPGNRQAAANQPGQQGEPQEGQPGEEQQMAMNQRGEQANQAAQANRQGQQAQTNRGQQGQQNQQGRQGQQGQGQQPQEAQDQQQNAESQQDQNAPGQQAQNNPRQPGQRPQNQPGQQGQQGQGQQPQNAQNQQPPNANSQQAQNAQGQPGQQPGQPAPQAQNPQGQGGQNQQQNQNAQAQNGRGQGNPQNPRDPQARQQGEPRDPTQANAANPQGAPGQDEEARKPGRRMGDQRIQTANAERGAGGRQQRRGGNFFDEPDAPTDADPRGPLTGRDYENWSDRLGNVEEMIDEPDLRNELAQVRERARSVRSEFKRQGKSPQWPFVQTQIAEPLVEVRNRVAEELAKRESKDALVPIDRDPVPTQFSDLVRRYYEKLGQNK